MAIFTFLFNAFKAAYFAAYLAWLTLPLLMAAWAALMVRGGTPYVVAVAGLFFVLGLLLKYSVHRLIRQLRELLSGPSVVHGSARYATRSDVRALGLLGWSGLILGRWNGKLLRYRGDGHLLTFAPTRSGKGVGCVVPNLLSYRGSVLVTDIKGENWRLTSAWRATLGPVHALAPFDPSIANAAYNPLDFLRLGTPWEVDDARLIAEMLVTTVDVEPNHWEREARTLLTGLILHVAKERAKGERTLQRVRALLMRDAAGFEAVLAAMRQSSDPVIVQIAEGFGQKEVRERSAVVSTAQSRTEVFDSPQLAAATARSTFRLEDLKDRSMSLYIVVPPEYLRVYQPFLRLMVGLATVAMTRNPARPELPVLFLLDELPALGYMRPIEEGIGYLAGYGVRLWLFVQDLTQLARTYPKAESMIANCEVRQAFNVQDPVTARLLSDMLGVTTVQAGTAGRSGNLPLPLVATSYHGSTGDAPRALLTPDEVMALPRDRQLLFVQGARGILAHKLRYYTLREWWLRRRVGGLMTATAPQVSLMENVHAFIEKALNP